MALVPKEDRNTMFQRSSCFWVVRDGCDTLFVHAPNHPTEPDFFENGPCPFLAGNYGQWDIAIAAIWGC